MLRLGEFQKLYPETDVTLVTETRFADVANNEFDVGIRCCSKGSDHLGFDVISTAPYYPYASQTIRCPTSRSTFSTIFCCIGTRGRFGTIGLRRQVSAASICTARHEPFNSTLAIEGALAGQGVVLSSPELVVNEINSGRLRRLSDIGSRFKGYFLVYAKGARRRKSVEAFRRWFIDETTMFRD